MGIHDNHRQRLRQRYLEQGADGLSDLQLLELYLFSAIPRRDVNPLANALLARFGSLDGVFRAELSELSQVPGLGPNAAGCLRLLRDLSRRAALSRSREQESITHWQQAGEYLLPHFFGATTERVMLLCLDAGGRVLHCQPLGRGEVGLATVELGELLQLADSVHAATVLLAHNHPGGSLAPSEQDVAATLSIKRALARQGITLLDHLIVAQGDFASLRRSLSPEEWAGE